MRQFAAKMLAIMLESIGSIYTAPYPSVRDGLVHEDMHYAQLFNAILRRAVCPAIVACSMTCCSSTMKNTLKCAEVIWTKFNQTLSLESVVLLNHFIEYLGCRFMYPFSKSMVIEMLQLPAFSSLEALSKLFQTSDLYEPLQQESVKQLMAYATLSLGGSDRDDFCTPGDIQEIKRVRYLSLELLISFASMCKFFLDSGGSNAVSAPSSSQVWKRRLKARECRLKLFQEAASLWQTKKNFKVAFQHLRDNLHHQGIMYDKVSPDNQLNDLLYPRFLAQFLRTKGLDSEWARTGPNNQTEWEVQVGDILGIFDDTFMTARMWEEIRREFVRQIDLTDIPFIDAIRYFLTNGGFHLPGESQKIDRILQVFADQYCASNHDVFEITNKKDSDPCFLVAFSVIMLNKLMTSHRTTLDEYVRMLRGENGGKDFSLEFLGSIYNSIATKLILQKDYVGTLEPKMGFMAKLFSKYNSIVAKPILSKDDVGTLEPISSFERMGERQRKERDEALTELERQTLCRLRKTFFQHHHFDFDAIVTWDLLLSLVQLLWQPVHAAFDQALKATDVHMLVRYLKLIQVLMALFKAIAESAAADHDNKKVHAIYSDRVECLQSIECRMKCRLEWFDLRQRIITSCMRENKYKREKYPNCFCASDVINWMLVNSIKLSREEAVKALKELSSIDAIGLSCLTPDDKLNPNQEYSDADKRLFSFRDLGDL